MCCVNRTQASAPRDRPWLLFYLCEQRWTDSGSHSRPTACIMHTTAYGSLPFTCIFYYYYRLIYVSVAHYWVSGIGVQCLCARRAKARIAMRTSNDFDDTHLSGPGPGMLPIVCNMDALTAFLLLCFFSAISNKLKIWLRSVCTRNAFKWLISEVRQ